MLVKKSPTKKLKLTLHIDAQLADRLEQVRRIADTADFALDLESSVVKFIEKQVSKAEKELSSSNSTEAV